MILRATKPSDLEGFVLLSGLKRGIPASYYYWARLEVQRRQTTWRGGGHQPPSASTFDTKWEVFFFIVGAGPRFDTKFQSIVVGTEWIDFRIKEEGQELGSKSPKQI